MTIAFERLSNADSGNAGHTGSLTISGGSASRQLLIALFGFEGVAAGSGPWVANYPGGYPPYEGNASGWYRICYQAPSATGNGVEVWSAFWQSGTTAVFEFTGTMNYVAQMLVYNGQYDPGGTPDPLATGVVRVAPTAQVTGNAPAAPSVYAFQNEMVVAVGADQMTASEYGTPTGYNSRLDSARGGTAGNVEITAADAFAGASGNTGLITFPNNAASTSTKGATATLVIRPVAGSGPSSPPTTTSPMVVAEYR